MPDLSDFPFSGHDFDGISLYDNCVSSSTVVIAIFFSEQFGEVCFAHGH